MSGKAGNSTAYDIPTGWGRFENPAFGRTIGCASGALLSKAGIDLSELTNMDLLDAALCALAAYHLAIGRDCVSYGEQESGLIIVPK